MTTTKPKTYGRYGRPSTLEEHRMLAGAIGAAQDGLADLLDLETLMPVALANKLDDTIELLERLRRESDEILRRRYPKAAGIYYPHLHG